MRVDFSTIAGRLSYCLRASGLTQAALADAIPCSATLVSEVKAGRSRFSPEKAARAAEALGVDPEWFGTGHGAAPAFTTAETANVADLPQERLLEELRRRMRLPGPPQPPVVDLRDADVDLADFVAIPYMADAASAGSGRVVGEDIEDYIIAHRKIAANPDHLVCVKLHGNSMEPGLPEGSIVAIDRRQRDPYQCNGKVVCARTPDDLVVVKRLRLYPECAFLDSDNEHDGTYEPILIASDARYIETDWLIGRVVWAWVDHSK